jgi:two-component system NtrC family response regulator/two-component system response regulator HydG
VERAVVMCNDDLIGPEHLPGHDGSGKASSAEMGILVPGITLDELERMAIMQALEAASGSTAQAAEMLGVSRRKVQYRLKEWGLTGVWSHESESD